METNFLSTALLQEPHKYVTVHATRSRVHTGDGMWYYEVSILTLDSEGGTAVIGWDVPRDSLSPPPLPGQTCNDIGQVGLAWQSDGLLHLKGKSFASEVWHSVVCAKGTLTPTV